MAAQRGDLPLGGGEPLAQVGDLVLEQALLRIRLRSWIDTTCVSRCARSTGCTGAARGARGGGPGSIAASELRRQWTQVQSTSSIGSSIPCWARNSSTARRHSSSAP